MTEIQIEQPRVNGTALAPLSSGLNGRDSQGRFTKRASPGPGRTPRQVEESYVQAMHRGCTPENWEAITCKMVAQAKRGDVQAAAWLSRHMMPPPRPAPGFTLTGNTAQRIAQLERALAEGLIGAAEAIILHRVLELELRADSVMYAACGQVVPRQELLQGGGE